MTFEQLEIIHEAVRKSNRHPIKTGKRVLNSLVYQFHKVDYRIKQAKEIILEALSLDIQWCVNVSFGKDSLVLLDIFLDLNPDITVLFVNRGLEAELPETPLLIEALQKRRPFNLVEVYPKVTIMSLYEQLGGIPGLTTHDPDSIIRKVTLSEPADEWMKRNDIGGYFMGRRAQENEKTRGKHLRIRGPLYQKKDELWTCDPLAWWTAKDIWAYIVQKNLPYHPAYDLEDNREQARMSSWAGMAGVRYGRWKFLQKHYPELWNYFTARFPEARSYT